MKTTNRIFFSILLSSFVVACASRMPPAKTAPPAMVETPPSLSVEPEQEIEPEIAPKVVKETAVPKPPMDKSIVLFKYDSSELSADAKEIVNANALFLADNAEFKVIVQGHADERGSNEYNLALGKKRTQTIKQILLANGLAESRIGTVSFGEEQPIEKEQNEEAWRSNRRAVFVYITGDLQQALEQQKSSQQVFAFDN